MKEAIFLLVGIAILCATAFEIGKNINQQEIEKRALHTKNKTCYDWNDIELIIFKNIQE